MRFRSSALVALCGLGVGACVIAACGSGDDSGAPNPTPDGGADAALGDATTLSDASGDATSPIDATPSDASKADASDGATHDAGDASVTASDAGDGGASTGDAGDGGASAGDGGDAATAAVPTFLTHFSLAAAQNPEGLWEIGDASTPIVGLANLAQLVTVSPGDAGVLPFGSVGEAGTAANSFTLGITTDAAGNVYVGIGAAAANGIVPAPGIYKFAPGGGAGTLFSSAANMNFPNGLDFIGTTLFVADSGGTIFAIDPAGVATVWSSDPLLAAGLGACEAGPPLALGANGITHDANNVYVTNTDFGRVMMIPMNADGGAGAGTAIVDSCTYAGADGIVRDTRDNSLIVAVNIQDKIVRVSLDGGTSVLASGAPLDAPASLIIDTSTGTRRLLFTNAAFFSADAGQPGLLSLPIP